MKMPKHSSLPKHVSPQRAAQQARPGPAVAQPKIGPQRLNTKSPVAPPAYRPQPVPKVLQAKKDVSRMSLKPAATPTCCPRPGLVQPKISTAQKTVVGPSSLRPVAPPAYSPEQKSRVMAPVQRASANPSALRKTAACAQPSVASRFAPSTLQAKPALNNSLRPPVAHGHNPQATRFAKQASPTPRTNAPNMRHAPVVQAKYDVIIEPELPEETQKDLVVKAVTITDRPAYPDKIEGVFRFGAKKNEKGHTLAWDILKLHYEHKYKNKTIAEVATDLNSTEKKKVTGGAVKPTVSAVSDAMKKWIEYKHKQETIYWDSSGENAGRGSFFRGVKDEYLYYKNKTDDESTQMKQLYQELMVLSAVDFQTSDSKEIKTARVDRAKRKLGRVYSDDFSRVTLDKWSGEVDELRRYKDKEKLRIQKNFKFNK